MFKAGDRVECIKESSNNYFGNVGGIYTIKRVNTGVIVLEEDPKGWGLRKSRFKLIKEWAPKNGEMIEVSNNSFNNWYKRVFVGMSTKGGYVCESESTIMDCFLWKEARQATQTKTITIDGKDLEISQESFESLREFFKSC